MTEKLVLSSLPKTWIFDVDGTLVIHNGHKTSEGDRLLPNVKEFFQKIPKEDTVILLTARKESRREELRSFLQKEGIRFDYLLCGMPFGERILINDMKPSGLCMAYAINQKRNQDFDIEFKVDLSL